MRNIRERIYPILNNLWRLKPSVKCPERKKWLIVTHLSGNSDSWNDEMTLSENRRKQWMLSIVSKEEFFYKRIWVYLVYTANIRLSPMVELEDRAEDSWNIHPWLSPRSCHCIVTASSDQARPAIVLQRQTGTSAQLSRTSDTANTD